MKRKILSILAFLVCLIVPLWAFSFQAGKVWTQTIPHFLGLTEVKAKKINTNNAYYNSVPQAQIFEYGSNSEMFINPEDVQVYKGKYYIHKYQRAWSMDVPYTTRGAYDLRAVNRKGVIYIDPLDDQKNRFDKMSQPLPNDGEGSHFQVRISKKCFCD